MAASVGAFVALTVFLFGYSQVAPGWQLTYYVLFLCLFYCCLAYQLNRFGAAMRQARRVGLDPADEAALLAADAPSITVLIPSYREERRVLRMTVLSAALARYGQRRIVVLVDDPPRSDSIDQSLATVDEVRTLLAEPLRVLGRERSDFLARQAAGGLDLASETRHLARLHGGVARWLMALGQMLEREISEDFRHVDRFFIERVVLDLARWHRKHMTLLSGTALGEAEVAGEYDGLARVFAGEISSFTRKRYQNLSHAANKAMNLNSYLGLMGGSYNVVEVDGREFLEVATGEAAALDVPASKYVLTLDADSVILPDYMLELTALIERDDGIGVVQTPYLTFPDSVSPVERVAGATTDIQYMVHQGSSYFGAAYWVGANALLRLSALDVIHQVQREGDKDVDVYIQDATVIEDTGSTIDLLGAGWRVQNHFRALAYSATPADFGSLAIQRQRWSNGGIIIFPLLLRQYLGAGGRVRRVVELMLRSHYLLSPLIGNAAVFLLMILSTVDARHLVLTPLAMVPYFVLYGLDLKRAGYRFRDVFAVSALNLMLLPVGIAGVIASLKQLITGRKTSFKRTPKVAGRTAVAPVYILFNLGMFALMARYIGEGVMAGEWLASLVPGVNVALYGYGLVRFIGLREGAEDLGLAAAELLRPLGAALMRPVRRVGRLAGHPATRVAAAVLGLSMGLLPIGFGSADPVQVNMPAAIIIPHGGSP